MSKQPNAQTNLSFGQAVKAMKKGKMASRKGWNGKNLFVFMQVPSEIPLEVVPKMQSLPQSVKDVLIRRHEGAAKAEIALSIDPIYYNSIRYSNQFAIVHPDNSIHGWAPSASDSIAEDWVIQG